MSPTNPPRKPAKARKQPPGASQPPLLDDYFIAARRLADVVRRAVDGKVKRKEITRALADFERLDWEAV